MDVEVLARIQFAFTAGYHYIYPTLSIGIGLILVIMEGLYLKTKNPHYHTMAYFWTRVFGLTFAMGVATGIVMEFEFGTNWATYSRFVGDVFGSALAAEGIFAFFLESGFLAILLFGWDKVGPRLHFFSTCMVCLGSHFSAVWIIVANSWMQTPAGYHIEVNGQIMPKGYALQPQDLAHARAVIDHFWELVLNPSSIDRLIHAVLGCWITGAFFVMSVSAFYLLRKEHAIFAMRSFKIGLSVAMVACTLQIISGDFSARGVAKNQPAKLAAMEGIFNTQAGAPLSLAGWVDMEEQTTKGLEIPGLLSFLVGHSKDTVIQGLNDFPREDWPKVPAVFQLYHLMIGIGSVLFLMAFVGGLLWWRKQLIHLEKPFTRAYLFLCVPAVLLPQIANQAGWFTAEMGRQPWIVYGLLRTSQGLSQMVVANQVLFSLILFFSIYTLLFIVFIFLLTKKIHHGPPPIDSEALKPHGDTWHITHTDHRA